MSSSTYELFPHIIKLNHDLLLQIKIYVSVIKNYNQVLNMTRVAYYKLETTTYVVQ